MIVGNSRQSRVPKVPSYPKVPKPYLLGTPCEPLGVSGMSAQGLARARYSELLQGTMYLAKGGMGRSRRASADVGRVDFARLEYDH